MQLTEAGKEPPFLEFGEYSATFLAPSESPPPHVPTTPNSPSTTSPSTSTCTSRGGRKAGKSRAARPRRNTNVPARYKASAHLEMVDDSLYDSSSPRSPRARSPRQVATSETSQADIASASTTRGPSRTGASAATRTTRREKVATTGGTPGPATTTSQGGGRPSRPAGASRVPPLKMPFNPEHKIARGRGRRKQLAAMTAEEKRAEKALRMERMRLSARECRLRKKENIAELEEQLDVYEQRNLKNVAEIRQLKSQVEQLQASILGLKRMIKTKPTRVVPSAIPVESEQQDPAVPDTDHYSDGIKTEISYPYGFGGGVVPAEKSTEMWATQPPQPTTPMSPMSPWISKPAPGLGAAKDTAFVFPSNLFDADVLDSTMFTDNSMLS